LIAFVFVDRFNRRIFLTNRCVDPVPERWSARGHPTQRRGRLAEMGQDDQTSASRATAHAMFTSRLKRLSAGKLAPGVAGRTLAQRPAIG